MFLINLNILSAELATIGEGDLSNDDRFRTLAIKEGLEEGGYEHYFPEDSTAQRLCSLTNSYYNDLGLSKPYPYLANYELSAWSSCSVNDWSHQWNGSNWLHIDPCIPGIDYYLRWVNCSDIPISKVGIPITSCFGPTNSLNTTIRNDLNHIAFVSIYYLANDIDCSQADFLPMDMFVGKLDGNYNKIKNLHINRSGDLGIFQRVNSGKIINLLVENISIVNAQVTSQDYTGFLFAGYTDSEDDCENLFVANVSISGTMIGGGRNGGIVGRCNSLVIKDSYVYINMSTTVSSGDVNAYLGGLVGSLDNSGSITNSYVFGNISAPNDNDGIGGLVGNLDQNSMSIINSYFSGTIRASPPYGALVGTSSGTISNCYYNTTSVMNCVGTGSGTCLSTLKTNLYDKTFNVYDTTVPVWDFNNIWQERINDYPIFKWQCTPSCAGKECGSDGCGINNNCGTCLNSHGTTSCSVLGICQPVCYFLWGNCDLNNVNGCETDLSTFINCGFCGNSCTSGQICNSTGWCVYSCVPKNCSELGKQCGTWDNGCGTANLTCSSCNFGEFCNSTGQCEINLQQAYWTDLKDVMINESNIGDSVKLIVNIENIQNREVNYTVYKSIPFWRDRKIAQFSNRSFSILMVNESGIFYFKAKVNGLANEIQSGNLEVSEIQDNSKPNVVIVKPVNESNFIIQNIKTYTENISLEQISSDEDDDLKITWNFGDNKNRLFSNCLTTSNCNTTYSYNSSGTKIIESIAEEMTRNQKAIDRTRIYVFKEGLIIFAIIDSPPYKSVLANPGETIIDGRSSYVANCSFDRASCNFSSIAAGKGSCYSINDSNNLSNNIWCYKIADSSQLNFTWIIDPGTPEEITKESDNQPLSMFFIEAKEHIIKLIVKYVY